MAATEPFARRLVNSGRLSEPCSLFGLSLQADDNPMFQSGLRPGSPCVDAPIGHVSGASGWLLDHLGREFVLLSRYGALPGSAYLIRPDQHVAARFCKPTGSAIATALARASGKAVS
jgi:3-(3-hydroxy-phenyl)propionate hydroxylase